MKNAVIYARFSSHAQSEPCKQGFTDERFLSTPYLHHEKKEGFRLPRVVEIW